MVPPANFLTVPYSGAVSICNTHQECYYLAMKRCVLSAALLLALPLAAQSVPKVKTVTAPTAAQQEAPKQPAFPPTISDALKAEFFKAQAFKFQADAQAEKINTLFQAAIANMRKVCGDSATLQTNPNGDPICVANPAPDQPAKK